MGISRAAQSPASVHRNIGISRLRRHDINQIRCLWWWGKHSRGWWTNQQDDIEERLRRHQALMMHRYTKAMRRRSLWDRENSPAFRPWRSSIARMERDMSSTDPLRAKVEDRGPENKSEKQPWHNDFYKDFDAFKKVVDQAIARDPYGTLFGRRLQSPSTANNSSWTSWSWIFDPKEIKQDPVPEPPKEQKKATPSASKPSVTPQAPINRAPVSATVTQASISHSSSSGKASTTIKSSQSIIFQDRTTTATEYIYDPITGRKVAKASGLPITAISPVFKESKALEPIKEAPKQSLIESLFTEHGTPIAVKVFKPPKVFGYTSEATSKPKPDSPSILRTESSRKKEFNDLRWRTLGNNIDSTNFNCEPWNRESEVPSLVVEQPTEERIRTSPAPNEDNPLFTGTTYESKSEQLIASQSTPQKDDFRAKQGMTIPSFKIGQQSPSRSFEPATKIEPAVDRTSVSGIDIPVKKFISKLPTAVDRVVGSSRLEPATERIIRPVSKPDPPKHESNTITAPRINKEADEQQDKREDIDLLRASDIRANTKSTRVTKQATEDKKQQERTVLEQQFEKNAVSDKTNLESVWKHVRQYPGGIVAKTMQSLGVTNPLEAASSAPPSAPKFSEPTTRPDVVRDRAMENHTQVFEFQVVNIIDQAESVKRNLRDVAHTINHFVNERAVTTFANRGTFPPKSGPWSIVTEKVEPSSASPPIRDLQKGLSEIITRRKESFDIPSGNPPFILLYLFPVTGEVRSSPMHELLPSYRSSQSDFSPMATLGSLSNPSGFLKHFSKLDQMGYELMHGSKVFLVFRKKDTAPVEQQQPIAQVPSLTSLRASVAAEEAASQPKTQNTAGTSIESMKAAEVLDQIPTTIPTPGPSAPTAPASPIGRPSTKSIQKPTKSPITPPPQSTQSTPVEPSLPPSQPEPQPTSTQSQSPEPKPKTRKPKSQSQSRISRQEEVFSGLQRLKPQTTALPDPEHFQKQTPSTSQQTTQQYYQEHDSTPRLGFFARVRRAIRRTVLTALAFGAGAYGIGVVAEGLQARAQISQGDEGGPMKRVVFEGDAAKKIGDRQRAGIFSTESSR